MILVTGASGRTGGEVVKALVAKGEQVRALVRDPQKAGRLKDLGVEIAVGDLDRPDTLVAALSGVDKAFLLSTESANLATQHRNFAEAAKKAGVKHIVRMSILVAMPDTPLVLGQWHNEADQGVKDSGVPYTFLKPAYFMQNILQFADMIKDKGMLPNPMGSGKVGLIDVRDIASVAAAVLTGEGHEGKEYILTGPAALSFGDVAGKLSRVLGGKEVMTMDMSPDEAKMSMVKMGMPDDIADAWAKLGAMVARGMADMTTPAVKEVTGQNPRTIDAFLEEFVDKFRG